MSVWLEKDNEAVICRIAAPGRITSSAIFYTNNDLEANNDGSLLRQAPVIRTKKASYYYFATKAKLKSLSTTGFTLRSSFNRKMMIDCMLHSKLLVTLIHVWMTILAYKLSKLISISALTLRIANSKSSMRDKTLP